MAVIVKNHIGTLGALSLVGDGRGRHCALSAPEKHRVVRIFTLGDTRRKFTRGPLSWQLGGGEHRQGARP